MALVDNVQGIPELSRLYLLQFGKKKKKYTMNFTPEFMNTSFNHMLDNLFPMEEYGDYDAGGIENFDPVLYTMDQMNTWRGANYSNYEDNRLKTEGYDYSNTNNINSVAPTIKPDFRPSLYLPEATELDAIQNIRSVGGGEIEEKQPGGLKGMFNGLMGNSSLMSNLGAGFDMGKGVASMFSRGNKTYNGPKGGVRAGIELGWDATANTLSKIPGWGLAAGLGMKAAGMLNQIQGAIFGATDGMTTTDAVFDSPIGFLTGVGWVNQAFGQKSDTITKNEEMLALAGNSLSGLVHQINDAVQVSGKKYGAFSNIARIAANRLIMDAKTKQEIAENNVDEANTARALRDSMAGINNLSRYYRDNGGINRMSVGKDGMKILTRAERIAQKLNKQSNIKEANLTNSYKFGGSIIKEISLPTSITEILLTSSYKFGGKLSDDPIKYSIDRFPILSTLPTVQLQPDNAFTPGHNIEYMESKYDTLPYYNDYSKFEENKGKSTIVYNSNVIDEDIALDWLSHGLREYDETYNQYLNKLSKDWEGKIKDEMFSQWLDEKDINNWNELSDIDKQKLKNVYSLYRRTLQTFRPEEYYEQYNSTLDGLVRALLVKDEYRKKLKYDYPKEELEELKESSNWKELYNYIFNNTDKFAKGGKFNVIPEGALHARKHNLNIDNITNKGIPVISQEEGGLIELQAEIERNEIIFRLEVTEKIEELCKKYDSDLYSQEEKDLFAIEAGDLLVKEILYNTQDNTNLINTI